VTAYPGHVLQRAYAWMRGHPVAADGMLGVTLLAASAGQLHLGDAETTALAAVLVNVLLALAGLRERIRTVDGRLGIDSPPGGPTVVTIELPGHA
jgi:hypothetical protein